MALLQEGMAALFANPVDLKLAEVLHWPGVRNKLYKIYAPQVLKSVGFDFDGITSDCSSQATSK